VFKLISILKIKEELVFRVVKSEVTAARLV